MGMLNGCQLLEGAEFFVGIDGHGLWPNLTKLPSGAIGAAIYNHPSHGLGSGSNVEWWISGDEGRFWSFRSTLSDLGDTPDGIRMNHAVGLGHDGGLVALVSGYHKGQKRPFLPLQCCRSADEGQTWERCLLPDDGVPFGDILALPDGSLACPFYRRLSDTPKSSEAFLRLSSDRGMTWETGPRIAEGNETHVLRCRDGFWLATTRSSCPDRLDDALPHGGGQWLYRSEDAGQSWEEAKPISPQGQENAHLLELHDGTIVCSFTSRIPGLFGVVLRLSSDRGRTWSLPTVLISIPARDWHKTDCGYPSSVEMPDGTVVTAYYFGPKSPEWSGHSLPWHQRYHMGVARWRPESVPV